MSRKLKRGALKALKRRVRVAVEFERSGFASHADGREWRLSADAAFGMWWAHNRWKHGVR